MKFTWSWSIIVLYIVGSNPLKFIYIFCCYCSFAQSCPTLCHSMECSTPGFLKLMSIESVVPSNYFILCHLLLLLPSMFPNIRVFSNGLAFWIRWPTYWSFSLNIIHHINRLKYIYMIISGDIENEFNKMQHPSTMEKTLSA